MKIIIGKIKSKETQQEEKKRKKKERKRNINIDETKEGQKLDLIKSRWMSYSTGNVC